MTKSSLHLKLEGQVTLARLNQALDAWTDFLREVSRDVVGASGRDAVRFIVTEARGGSLTLGVNPQPARKGVPVAVVSRISRTVTAGVRSLQRTAKRPKHFTDTALLRLKELASLADPETPAVKVGNGTSEAVQLTSRLIANIDAVLAPEVDSIGTVEGNLEGLIIHGKRRFLIFDPITQRQVICYFSERIDWETVLHAFGKRVAATGFLRSRRSGDKVSITVSKLYVFPPEEALPAIDSMLGVLKAAK